MSDIVRNPEDRFSIDAPHKILIKLFNTISKTLHRNLDVNLSNLLCLLDYFTSQKSLAQELVFAGFGAKRSPLFSLRK